MTPYNSFIFLFFFLTVYVGACSPSLAPFFEKTHPKDRLETPSENTPSFSLSTGNEKNGEIILSIHSYSLIRYTVSSLLDPLRLVLDFTEMKKGGLPDLFPVNRGVVDKVRTFYFRNGNVLRMEIFLNQDANYHIKAGSENKLSIHLDYPPALQSKAEESSVPEKPIQTESIPSSEKALLGGSSVTATDTDS